MALPSSVGRTNCHTTTISAADDYDEIEQYYKDEEEEDAIAEYGDQSSIVAGTQRHT